MFKTPGTRKPSISMHQTTCIILKALVPRKAPWERMTRWSFVLPLSPLAMQDME